MLIDAVQDASKFCGDYREIGQVMLWFVPGFMGLAAVSAAAFAFAEIIARLRPNGVVRAEAPPPAGLGVMIKALTDLIAALASAPIWLSMFALGVALYWFVGAGYGATCVAKPAPAPTATTSVTR